ncbi:MAG: GTP-binding protein [Planctomycetota bacterium]|jgi:GTP-binding protein
MQFRDECEISVAAGKGGDGLVSFRREKYAPKGGPNGGDGGDGGSVILRATDRVHSLLQVGRRPIYKAGSGRPGGPNNCYGKSADDLLIDVPIGTQIFDARRGHILRDLAADGDVLVLAQGGRGGRGNSHFATAVKQTPRYSEPGRPGEARPVRLELKLFADVGLVGLPNAGKSTFLSRITKATPKIADYPFTTLVPQVGIAMVGDHDTLVLADLPGLIEGAAEGAGLGHQFLRHIERCRVLLHLIDFSGAAVDDPIEAHAVISAELERYSSTLATRPRLIVATKVEDDDARARVEAFESESGIRLVCISSVTGAGVEQLLVKANKLVREIDETSVQEEFSGF